MRGGFKSSLRGDLKKPPETKEEPREGLKKISGVLHVVYQVFSVISVFLFTGNEMNGKLKREIYKLCRILRPTWLFLRVCSEISMAEY